MALGATFIARGRCGPDAHKGGEMQGTGIDLDSLPELDLAAGLFGSAPWASVGDDVIGIIVYLYDHMQVDMLL